MSSYCITVCTYCSQHCPIKDKVFINVVMDNEDDYKVMENWMKVAEWREAKRQQEEEERVMSRGVQRVRLSGISNREFFQVDRRDEIRQQQRMKKQEDEDEKKSRMRRKKGRTSKIPRNLNPFLIYTKQ